MVQKPESRWHRKGLDKKLFRGIIAYMNSLCKSQSGSLSPDLEVLKRRARASKMKVHPAMLLKTRRGFGQFVTHPAMYMKTNNLADNTPKLLKMNEIF